MTDTYFDYALSQCRMQSISAVCDVDTTQKALQDRARRGFNGCRNITEDWRLFENVSDCLRDHDIIDPKRLEKDAKTIYERCVQFFLYDCEMRYESWFDHLVELNWLLASKQNSEENDQRCIVLLTDSVKIIEFIRKYLLELYNSAVQYNNESVYIEEALKARSKIFSGFYDLQYEGAQKYLSRDYSYHDIELLERDYRDKSIYKMSLFYGLTATAALAEYIRRHG